MGGIHKMIKIIIILIFLAFIAWEEKTQKRNSKYWRDKKK
jgi:hypothetical protein